MTHVRSKEQLTSQYVICAASFATEDDILPDGGDIMIVIDLALNDTNRIPWENVRNTITRNVKWDRYIYT